MANANRTTIAALLASYPEDVPPSRAAKMAVRELQRYASSSWRFDCALDALPESSSTRRRLQHAILRHSNGHVFGWRQLLRLATKIGDNKARAEISAFFDKASRGPFSQA
jgi:hypothetical protein